VADSAVFEWACEELERASGLSRLQARGTLRLVLGQAGLDPRSVRAAQLRVIALRLLPKELRARGLENVDEICEGLSACPASTEPSGAEADDTEEVFKRLGRRE
jgi:hypothetical protein